SAFDSVPQARLLARIDAAFASIAAASPAPLTLEQSGANRFAVAAEAGIRRDVHWIVAVSSLGVAVVFLAFLRSLRFFVLVVLPAFLPGNQGGRSAPPLAARISGAFGDGVRWLALRPRILGAATLACVALCAAFAPRLRFDDDLSHLLALDPKLRAEEERV